MSGIKDRLGYLYSSINYTAVPKATDLEKFFEVRPIVIYEKKDNGSRKQIKGYELLKKKG